MDFVRSPRLAPIARQLAFRCVLPTRDYRKRTLVPAVIVDVDSVISWWRRLVTDCCFHKSRQAARRRHSLGMKVAVLEFVPLGKGMEALRKLPPRILRQGVSVGLTLALKHHPSQEGDSRRSCSRRLVAPRSMKIASPLDKGGRQGGFERGNETHCGAALSRSRSGRRRRTRYTNHPRRGRWPGIPSLD
jgi:hypothetical protein